MSGGDQASNGGVGSIALLGGGVLDNAGALPSASASYEFVAYRRLPIREQAERPFVLLLGKSRAVYRTENSI